MNKPIINVFIYSLSNYLMCKLCTFIGSLVFLFIYSKGLFLCTGLMKRDQERENMRRDWKSNKPYNTQHQRKSPLALTLRGEWFFVQYLTIPLPVDRPAPYLIDCLKGKVYFVMLMQCDIEPQQTYQRTYVMSAKDNMSRDSASFHLSWGSTTCVFLCLKNRLYTFPKKCFGTDPFPVLLVWTLAC